MTAPASQSSSCASLDSRTASSREHSTDIQAGLKVPMEKASNEPEYPFRISGSLVGVSPSPRPSACASGRTRLSAWLCAPCGRFLLHIRAGEGRRKMRRQEVSGIDRKLYSSESFPVSFFVMVSCPCWHFTVILSPAEKPACSSHLPCKRICGGAFL